MSLPKLCSLQNVNNKKYRCNHATKLASDYKPPQCLFELLPYGNETYAIKNVDNGEFYQNHIRSLASSVKGDGQLWTIVPDAEAEGTFTIQNVENGEYMTSHAGQLHKGTPGANERWVIEAREEAKPDLKASFYGFLKNQSNSEYRCNHAAQLKDKPVVPNCLTKFIQYDDGTVAIQNQDNYEFFQSSIVTMADRVTSNAQKWRLIEVDSEEGNTFYVKNVQNEKYMTRKASQLHAGKPGKDEVWVIEPFDCAQTSSWMSSNAALLDNKPLSEICLPASHDSGTYKRTYHTRYGTQAVTKTQIFDIQMQLMQGARKLDLRPALWNGDFYTAHYTDISKDSGLAATFKVGFQGAAGVALSEALAQVAAFIENNQGELVILKFSHFIDWAKRDDRKDNGLSAEQSELFISMVRDVLGAHLITGDAANLSSLTVNELLSKGNVIALMPNDFEGIDSKAGIWASDQLPGEGSYSNTNVLEKMEANQKEKLTSHSHDNQSFMMNISWQLTLDTSNSISGATLGTPTILSYAHKANTDLSPTLSEWLVHDVINGTYYPNTLQTDICYEEQTQAVALSLAITRQVERLLHERQETLPA
ncbi:hypothetical protein [Vibrio neptunius]|uniref:hypothetical protein n=1 Tax=Vibrio neptunius TaxID=170651 RepID=UPI001C5C9E74|nr:hypothetical protein [Vibrio neptunius]QXX07853.1 hypothetical protein KW548_07885 [Vibrio neptunius]